MGLPDLGAVVSEELKELWYENVQRSVFRVRV